MDALDLRDLFGDHGLLRFDIVSSAQKPYLPFERESSMECRRNRSHENPISCFLAGDYRANEQVRGPYIFNAVMQIQRSPEIFLISHFTDIFNHV